MIAKRHNITRRTVLAGAAASAAAMGAMAAPRPNPTFGNPGLPPQGGINNRSPTGRTDPGPQDPNLANQFPNLQNPPATDINGMQNFWASFNNAHRRIQNGGWARQVTQDDFAISEAFSGVNMRLGKFGIRELHWHQQSEWAIVTNGTCRITILDEMGRVQIADVGEGDLWFFPPGLPHSLQGMGEDGTEFLLGFDYGKASEFDTLLLTDFMSTMPPDVLAKNFSMPQSNFANIPVSNLWIFQGNDPGPLAQNIADTRSPLGAPPNSFVYPFSKEKPLYSSRGGHFKVADSSNFKASNTTAAVLLTIHPGGMRELHWHPTADEWQYWMKGKGRMTVFNTGPHSQTMDFHAGDIGYVKKNQGHYLENTGNTDLEVLALFKGPRYYEVTLANWLAHTPPGMVTDTLNITREIWAQIKKDKVGIVPF